MKRTICIVVVLLAVCGCGIIPKVDELLGVHREAPAVELPPQPSPALQEARSEAATSVLVGLIDEAEQTESPKLAAMARLQLPIVAALGVATVVAETVEDMTTLANRLCGLEGRHQTALDKDAAERVEAAGKSGTTGWSLTSGMLGTKLLLTGLGLSGVGIMGALAWVWKRGKALLATRTAFGQVVGSVSAGLAVLTPDQEKAVKGEMAKVQDTATEAAVAEVKTKVIGAG